jgi:hypothetical protein
MIDISCAGTSLTVHSYFFAARTFAQFHSLTSGRGVLSVNAWFRKLSGLRVHPGFYPMDHFRVARDPLAEGSIDMSKGATDNVSSYLTPQPIVKCVV